MVERMIFLTSFILLKQLSAPATEATGNLSNFTFSR